MSHDDPDFNPYQSSTSATLPEGHRPAGFPWRVIPSVLLVLFGGLLLLSAEAGLFWKLWRSPDPTRFLRSRQSLWFPLLNIVGGFWITSGIYFWRRLWWRAVLYLVAGYALRATGAYLIGRP